MSVRLKRLSADYEKVRTLFQGDARITLVEHFGMPPERYVLRYAVKSVQQDLESGKLKWLTSFDVEIYLPGTYPRTAPQCRMLTPVFHPNIVPHAICIGDHWAAGESLANLVVRIGEMLSYQSYNVKSPLNGDAAQWAEKNRDRLPIDTFDFSTILSRGEAVRAADRVVDGVCANCGARGETSPLQVCANGHVACEACILLCDHCGKTMCMGCHVDTCAICSGRLCAQCRARCSSCGHIACLKDATRCAVCRSVQCRNCVVQCATCGVFVCLEHMRKRPMGAKSLYVCVTCEKR